MSRRPRGKQRPGLDVEQLNRQPAAPLPKIHPPPRLPRFSPQGRRGSR